ncbi:MAG: dienelactone hydrolase family protein [Asticcacaulis sp.]|uniref:dienelactone hydrolase family protein n=1 Tax=Asticcacaulis sp. TaxID=1872648 RepID=UPI003F7C5A40
MDTMAQRWTRLKAYAQWFGPDDATPRPTLVLFHGCGGLRPHVIAYAKAAAAMGVRALVIDSFAPRGWDRAFAVSFVCTGLVFQGYDRTGDVLATLYGLKQDARVSEVMLAGFSHGGWTLMDLMTDPLDKPGAAKLADPDPALMAQVKALLLVYPYIGFPARSNTRNWVWRPPTFAVLAARDHLTPLSHACKVLKRLSHAGVAIETAIFDATHAFDEEDNKGPIMRFSDVAMAGSIAAMQGFIACVFKG